MKGHEKEATCSCGSGIPIQKVQIDGQEVTLIALPLIFEQFRAEGKQSSEASGTGIAGGSQNLQPGTRGGG